ncbi:hypothetical protein LshimejAT787_0805240 [Lyophyllum shimeji]|uniref:Uncharacterized protein n=1 Tax=Lyophyllum shimeji TaxID=47721 RepID=A0A9P3PSA5_LYOSH|nr:hypothetical protein LshimejAT787_0805240 [Lyophyllum shimeji]
MLQVRIETPNTYNSFQAPVVHLDPIFWSKAWIAAPPEQARAIVRQYADQDAWVMDGNQWVPLKDITYPRPGV